MLERSKAGGTRVLFFSRGRGCGHAIPDMAIADELQRLCDDLDLKFVSYGTGAWTFHQHHRPVIDLEMPDQNPLWETIVRTGCVIRQTHPHLVISHEDFAALPMAKLFNLPTIFITEWFSDPNDIMMQALSYADEVIVTEEEGIFNEPPNVEDKVFYAGPVMRSFSYSRADRNRARQELGFSEDATVILVVPGGWATEDREPIFDLVMGAFDALRVPEKLLLWLAGTDHELVAERCARRENVIVRDYDWQIDRLMVASDLAITKANRVTLRELSALGVPSISISHGLNPIDDILIERISTNTALDGRTASRSLLLSTILEVLGSETVAREGLIPYWQGAHLTAQAIANRLTVVESTLASESV